MSEAPSVTTAPPTWHQMRFHAPENRDEVLWVEARGGSRYAVLSVPVWLYGVSPGTIVEGKVTDGELEAIRILQKAAGATVRYTVPAGAPASAVYLSRILEDAKRLGYQIGPATFLNPLLCAFHIRRRADWWPKIGSYLESLRAEGVITQWEVGDPDEYGADPESSEDESPTSSELRHPLPIDGVDGRYVVS